MGTLVDETAQRAKTPPQARGMRLYAGLKIAGKSQRLVVIGTTQ
jgi:hypothetical protein